MPATSAHAAILRDAGIAFESAEDSALVTLRIAVSDVSAALGAFASADYEQLVDLFATDTGEAIEVTYHLRTLSGFASVFLKATVPYDGEIASAWQIYPAALFPEREAAELLGMSFPGHPNPKRLLTVEGTEPLLRKSVLIRDAEEVQYS
jgi:NADH:ubiquinone oxidoreductase subunit C